MRMAWPRVPRPFTAVCPAQRLKLRSESGIGRRESDDSEGDWNFTARHEVQVRFVVVAERRGLAAPVRCLGPCRHRYTLKNERVDTLSVGHSVDPCALTPWATVSPGRASR